MAKAKRKFIKFSVEAALLRELGERLVGKPEVALSELVKNGYDADAYKVQIRFEEDAIEIIDNGDGMTMEQFTKYWMSIGTTHKLRAPLTSRFGRQVTGSKGIGRLSAQFLGNRLNLWSISRTSKKACLKVDVDWNEAQTTKSLVESGAWVESVSSENILPEGWIHGTRIRITGLNQHWSDEAFKALARQLWYLRPPVDSVNKQDNINQFDIQLISGNVDSVEEFNQQMTAALNNWIAEISGKLENGTNNDSKAKITIKFKDEEFHETLELTNHKLNTAEFNIKVFNLSGRQQSGIEVALAREYFHKYGGVHIYDGSFRLPFYGGSQGDWLSLEVDHSHRLINSKLLPPALQSEGDLRDLPTNSRIFGIVRVSTNDEAIIAKRLQLNRNESLNIQLTRDRLIENEAFADLRYLVRWAVDLYAFKQSAKRQKIAAANSREVKSSEPLIEELQVRFSDLRSEQLSPIAKMNIKVIENKLNELEVLEQRRQQVAFDERVLLGALATAGMGSVALEHELGKEITALNKMLDSLSPSVKNNKEMSEAIKGFQDWIKRSIQLRKLFSPLMNDFDREQHEEFNAKKMISMVIDNSTPLLRGINIDICQISPNLLLPLGTMSSWQAIFQNIFVNAINALIDSPTRKIICKGGIKESGQGFILIEDTGVGIDLKSAEDLFKPFIRKLKISPERQALGLGGVGLGLTIVRMVAGAIKCNVRFVEPSDGMSTAFEISWNSGKDENRKIKNRHH